MGGVIASLLAAGGTILAAVFLLPQIVRILRRGDTAGVSMTWAAFGVVTNIGWVLYLGRLGLWQAVIAPALAVLTYSLLLGIGTSLDRRCKWLWASTPYVLCFAAAEPLGGPATLGLLLAATPVIQFTPELIAVFRERCPSGVSPATWCLAASEAILWGGYGWLVNDPALVGYGVATTTGAALILGRWTATRDRFPLVSSSARAAPSFHPQWYRGSSAIRQPEQVR